MLRNSPIERKLIVITMTISGVAVFFSCLVFMASDFFRQHDAVVHNLAATADLMGDKSTAALSSDDAASATLILGSLDTHPDIVRAVIYDKRGSVFATYRNHTVSGTFEPVALRDDGYRMEPRFLTLVRGIQLGQQRIGTLYLQKDMSNAGWMLVYYVLMLVVMTLIATGAAYLLARKLHKSISNPIFHLAAVVQQVAVGKNYSVRAVKHGEDELGQLIDGFNGMLNELQQRDLALLEARESLEARVAERTTELEKSVSQLNATLESTADGIMALDLAATLVSYNTQFAAMWDVPIKALSSGSTVTSLLAAKMKDPERFIQRVMELRPNGFNETFDVLELADGRTFERYIKPQKLDGALIGVVVNFRDITERKRREAELESVHRQLVDASRQAGMAEVASNVLHNVGNVLNSVNVSANLVADSIKRSKIVSLGKVTELLREHALDLSAYLTDDPQGRHLPGYLAQLSEHLLREQRDAVQELESLRSNIDHIKEIVSMQQSYSKVSGATERVNVIDLVEDTVRMDGGALQCYGVTLLREFDAVPMINTEKHKILQILVNLVRNAKNACCESAQTDMRITLRVTHDDDHVRIAVIDNGVGISAENMTRIFGHGFTTRKDGHGFGLHSGALAAQELGGALRVHSDGVGLGAIFTLELPLQQTESAYA